MSKDIPSINLDKLELVTDYTNEDGGEWIDPTEKLSLGIYSVNTDWSNKEIKECLKYYGVYSIRTKSGKIADVRIGWRDQYMKHKLITCNVCDKQYTANHICATPISSTEEVAIKHDTKESHPVNHSKHYTSHPSGIECIQITRHMKFNLGNAMKYIWRADEKGNSIEDLEKAVWYIKDEIEKRKQDIPKVSK